MEIGTKKVNDVIIITIIITKKNLFAGFPHLYYPSNPIFVEKFVMKAREYKNEKEL